MQIDLTVVETVIEREVEAYFANTFFNLGGRLETELYNRFFSAKQALKATLTQELHAALAALGIEPAPSDRSGDPPSDPAAIAPAV